MCLCMKQTQTLNRSQTKQITTMSNNKIIAIYIFIYNLLNGIIIMASGNSNCSSMNNDSLFYEMANANDIILLFKTHSPIAISHTQENRRWFSSSSSSSSSRCVLQRKLTRFYHFFNMFRCIFMVCNNTRTNTSTQTIMVMIIINI